MEQRSAYLDAECCHVLDEYSDGRRRPKNEVLRRSLKAAHDIIREYGIDALPKDQPRDVGDDPTAGSPQDDSGAGEDGDGDDPDGDFIDVPDVEDVEATESMEGTQEASRRADRDRAEADGESPSGGNGGAPDRTRTRTALFPGIRSLFE